MRNFHSNSTLNYLQLIKIKALTLDFFYGKRVRKLHLKQLIDTLCDLKDFIIINTEIKFKSAINEWS